MCRAAGGGVQRRTRATGASRVSSTHACPAGVDPTKLHARRHDYQRQRAVGRRTCQASADQSAGRWGVSFGRRAAVRSAVRSVHSAGNPRYFGRGKGVTYMNYTSAGSIGFFGFVVPATLRDSMVILDGLLEQHTSLRPTTLVTDSASYSDIVFGLFLWLGYRFCPRF